MAIENEFFIIRSGSDYLVKIENDTPFMTTDHAEASQYKGDDALDILGHLTVLGYDAQLIHSVDKEDQN